VCAQGIPGTFTFDSYFTNAEILNHINGKKIGPGRRRFEVQSQNPLAWARMGGVRCRG
jgi:hypothetical protein